MKTHVLVLAVGVLLACTGCTQPVDDTTSERVAALEAELEALETRNADLEFKGQLVSRMLGSPLENFFAADEFWENPYDSGQADCARRCVTTLTSERNACDDIGDCTQRQQCFQSAAERASQCQTQCSANNPPPIP